jgi:hypothetical protein
MTLNEPFLYVTAIIGLKLQKSVFNVVLTKVLTFLKNFNKKGIVLRLIVTGCL